jgi:hypothetical protein
MPRFMYVIAVDEAAMANATPEQMEQMMTAHNDWGKAVAEAGATVIAGDPLAPSSTATTVRHAEDGSPIVTDGPFAETKEALGGYYILECADGDVALALAKSLPAGTVELRPIVDLPS